ncbi:hypothetical protein VTI74DRAFT_9473 [Chaetomium olivicolor]
MSHFSLLTALLGAALALPNPQAGPTPVRILPPNWSFTITALSGPGCPDFNQSSSSSPDGFVTRPTYGSNTVDGSEIYYWHFAYPHLCASVGPDVPEASVWCETTLRYTELDWEGDVPLVPGYRLRLHKNGTAFIATYELEDGVEATWRVEYFTEEEEQIVDTLTVTGPRTGSHRDISPASKVQWALPECGTGTIKYRTELTYEGETEFYGVQQGVSYDWEKCAA